MLVRSYTFLSIFLILKEKIMTRYSSITPALRHCTTKLILFVGIALTSSAQAQLANGNYTYSNAQYTLKFTIVDNGWSIKNTTLTNKSSGQVETQKGGEFMKGGWYQFQTALCNYSFDDPKNALKLSKYDCKDKSVKDTSIDLKKN